MASSSGKGLLEADCGGANPLVKLTTDHSRTAVDDRLARTGLVREFLSETHQVTAARPPQTFRMDSLLEEMRQMEPAPVVLRQAPAVAELATTADDDVAAVGAAATQRGVEWVEEFRLFDTEQNVIDWSREYVEQHGMAGPDPLLDMVETTRWAADYLADVPLLVEEKEEAAASGEWGGPKLEPGEFEKFVASVGQETETKSGEIYCFNKASTKAKLKSR